MIERSQQESSPDPGARQDDVPADLQALARRYARQPVPRPTPDVSARLLARLLAEEGALRASGVPVGWSRRQTLTQVWRVLLWRVRLLGPTFCGASLVLLALGVAATLIGWEGLPAGAPLIAVVPLTAVLGLAHALRGPLPGPREVEASCPVGPLAAGSGLVLAVLGFDAFFAVLATAGLAFAGAAPFGPLALGWLAPLLLLAALAFPLALRWGFGPALLVGAGPWLLLVLFAVDGRGAAFLRPPVDATPVGHLLAAAVGASVLFLTLRAWPGWSTSPVRLAGG